MRPLDEGDPEFAVSDPDGSIGELVTLPGCCESHPQVWRQGALAFRVCCARCGMSVSGRYPEIAQQWRNALAAWVPMRAAAVIQRDLEVIAESTRRNRGRRRRYAPR